MSFITKIAGLASLGMLFALPLAMQTNRAAAQEGQPNQDQAAPVAVVYSYVAQPGDSYTKMARKAVQTYGKKTNTNLTLAGIVFAETNLTLVAGSPVLNVGQKVDISEATVKEWVDKAKNLTAGQQAAWGAYVKYVDFNTDRVGQAS